MSHAAPCVSQDAQHRCQAFVDVPARRDRQVELAMPQLGPVKPKRGCQPTGARRQPHRAYLVQGQDLVHIAVGSEEGLELGGYRNAETRLGIDALEFAKQRRGKYKIAQLIEADDEDTAWAIGAVRPCRLLRQEFAPRDG